MPDLEGQLTELVRLLVDQPDEVELTVVPGRRDTVIELRVAPDDLGKVIGRQGRTARSLRTLLETRGYRDGTRYELDILDEED